MLYLSYGMPKSGSTFVLQLTKMILAAHADDTHGTCDDLSSVLKGNAYPDYLDDDRDLDESVDSILKKTEGRRSSVVVKLHRACNATTRQLIEDQSVLASATFRHPAAMALSLMDAGRRDQSRGGGYFTRFDSLDSTRNAIHDAVASFQTWRTPRTLLIQYDDIALRPEWVARRIANQIGADVDVDRIVDWHLADKASRIAEFNKGLANRHLEELSPKEVASFEEADPEFCQFMRQDREELGA